MCSVYDFVLYFLKCPLFHDCFNNFFHYLFYLKFQEDNDVNQVNVETIENRQMPSYADVGRFLLKRNGKK